MVLVIICLSCLSFCNKPTIPASIFLIFDDSEPIAKTDFNPSFANLATRANILTNAVVKITTAGPLRKVPIVLNRPFTKAFPFSGSRALSKNSVNLVASPSKFSKSGPKVTDPILSANEVSPAIKVLI